MLAAETAAILAPCITGTPLAGEVSSTTRAGPVESGLWVGDDIG